MTAHKHVEMITAKANNMDLVALRKTNEGVWREVLDQSEIKFKSSYEYFLCLPQHKEACLHWLNGGECLVSYESVKGVSGAVTANNTPREWTPNSLFMKHEALIKIKPKKEKRLIVIHDGRIVDCLYKLDSDIRMSYGSKYDSLQIIKVEVEV